MKKQTLCLNLLAFIFGICACVGILLFIEVFFGFLNDLKIKKEKIVLQEWCLKEGKQFYLFDNDLGYKLIPNSRCYGIKEAKGKRLYRTRYSFDALGRRVIPIDNLKSRNKFILFFGCSFTLGVGVKNHKTMPYYVSKLTKEYIAYNYGVGAYGPQQMLSKLLRGDLKREIPQKTGMLIFTYIDGHIKRVIGSSILSTTWGKDFPNYELKGGTLIRKGSFTSGRPLLSMIYKLYSNSQVVKFFKLELPRINENHIKLTAKIFEESKNLFKEQFNSDDFYVLIYPLNSSHTRILVKYLTKFNVKYLDYSRLFIEEPAFRNYFPSQLYFIENDDHPKPILHKWISEKIVKDLALN